MEKEARKLDVGDGSTARWHVFNKPVWDALQPSLRLATKLLSNRNLSTFLDSLIFAPRELIDGSKLSGSRWPDHQVSGAHRFRLRNGPGTLDQKRWEEVLKAVEDMELSFKLALAYTEHKPSIFDVYGWTDNQPRNLRGFPATTTGKIFLSIWMVDPLLKAQLDESERLAQQFQFAVVHAIGWKVKTLRTDIPKLNLPPGRKRWREYEPVFGGIMPSLSNPRTQVPQNVRIAGTYTPFLGSRVDTWPDWKQYETYGDSSIVPRLITNRFGPGASRLTFPVPSMYVEMLQQEEFWNTIVPQEGTFALRVPKIFGIESVKGKGKFFVRGEDFKRLLGGRDPGSYQDPPPAPLSVNDYSNWHTNQIQLMKRHAIKTQLREQMRVKGEAGEDQKRLERAISAYREKDYRTTWLNIEDIEDKGHQNLEFQIKLLTILLRGTEKLLKEGRIRNLQRYFYLSLSDLLKLYEDDPRRYYFRATKTYSELAHILISYGAMKTEDLAEDDFRERLRDVVANLVLPKEEVYDIDDAFFYRREQLMKNPPPNTTQ
ncbi:hypothetical protein HYFRA_00009619 [Hymenoscyphus fraxineus]|uniref:Uncharacterized protein n=1 Tax=Hymenoscyphus fraxineus TaxID=746836 RepID=A0A9N9KUS5_9HELO|nr:hypothetical protein HYFRA_00009619 [Hymenoscyphus fraxineus]